MARLAKEPYPWPFHDILIANTFTNLDKLFEAEELAFQGLNMLADTLKPKEIVGRIVACPAGDGGAYYICTRSEPLTVAWIRYCDAYRAPGSWIRGLRKEDFLP